MRTAITPAVFALSSLVCGLPHLLGEELILIGGGPRPEAALARFVQSAGKDRMRLLIVSWASPTADGAAELKKFLTAHRPLEMNDWAVPPQSAPEKERFLAALAQATGVFFTGGYQTLLMRGLEDQSLAAALRKRYREGIVFGGTSAGTAIMSQMMLTGDGDFHVIDGPKVKTCDGLGLLPDDVIVDQHFVRRNRLARLAGLVLEFPSKMGVGIDEGTALLIKDNRRAEVVGAGKVVIFDGRGPAGEAGGQAPAGSDAGSLTMHVLKAGTCFDLHTRRLYSPLPEPTKPTDPAKTTGRVLASPTGGANDPRRSQE